MILMSNIVKKEDNDFRILIYSKSLEGSTDDYILLSYLQYVSSN